MKTSIQTEKKILHIIDSLGLGGAQTVVKGIFENQRNNHNIYVYALRKRKINMNIKHKNVFSCDSTSKYSILPLKDLKKIIKDNKIEVLHCHLFRSQVFGWLLKMLYFPRIKLLFHEHGQIFEEQKWYSLILNLLQKNVDLFIAVSKSTKNKLIKNAGINVDKLVMLYNFIEERNLKKINNYNKGIQRKKFKIRNNEFVIGFIGRLSKIKNIESLIKAIKLLKIDNFKVLIIGDGPEREYLQDLSCKLKLNSSIIFLGYRADVQQLYDILDIIILPSKSEASPMIFYESQAKGIPMIASDVAACNELVVHKENGLLFEFNNANDLARNIQLMYDNQELKKNIAINSKRNLNRFSFDIFLKDLKELYKNV